MDITQTVESLLITADVETEDGERIVTLNSRIGHDTGRVTTGNDGSLTYSNMNRQLRDENRQLVREKEQEFRQEVWRIEDELVYGESSE